MDEFPTTDIELRHDQQPNRVINGDRIDYNSNMRSEPFSHPANLHVTISGRTGNWAHQSISMEHEMLTSLR